MKGPHRKDAFKLVPENDLDEPDRRAGGLANSMFKAIRWQLYQKTGNKTDKTKRLNNENWHNFCVIEDARQLPCQDSFCSIP